MMQAGDINVAVDAELDARHLRCPLPLLKAKQALNALRPGQTLRVLATDSGSVRDFHLWTEQSGHGLLSFTEAQDQYCYVLQKKPA
jgi:tRNA 2-thiouridine synthesizing protein A